MKYFLRQLKEDMASASFAEAGEFDTARHMFLLDKNANKKVLLATNTAEVHSNVIRNALSLSKRMNARLEVLHVLTPQSTDSATML